MIVIAASGVWGGGALRQSSDRDRGGGNVDGEFMQRSVCVTCQSVAFRLLSRPRVTLKVSAGKRSSQVFLGGCQVECERKNKNIRIMKTVTEDVIKKLGFSPEITRKDFKTLNLLPVSCTCRESSVCRLVKRKFSHRTACQIPLVEL